MRILCIYYDMKKMVRWKLCLVYFTLYWIEQFPLLFEYSIDSFTNAVSSYMIYSTQELLLIQPTLSMIYKDETANSHFKFTVIWRVVSMQNCVLCMCWYIFQYLHVYTYMCICFQSTALFWVYIGDTALLYFFQVESRGESGKNFRCCSRGGSRDLLPNLLWVNIHQWVCSTIHW